jgi:hypothetical protein
MDANDKAQVKTTVADDSDVKELFVSSPLSMQFPGWHTRSLTLQPTLAPLKWYLIRQLTRPCSSFEISP